jgi:hypothetical protein
MHYVFLGRFLLAGMDQLCVYKWDAGICYLGLGMEQMEKS